MEKKTEQTSYGFVQQSEILANENRLTRKNSYVNSSTEVDIYEIKICYDIG